MTVIRQKTIPPACSDESPSPKTLQNVLPSYFRSDGNPVNIHAGTPTVKVVPQPLAGLSRFGPSRRTRRLRPDRSSHRPKRRPLPASFATRRQIGNGPTKPTRTCPQAEEPGRPAVCFSHRFPHLRLRLPPVRQRPVEEARTRGTTVCFPAAISASIPKFWLLSTSLPIAFPTTTRRGEVAKTFSERNCAPVGTWQRSATSNSRCSVRGVRANRENAPMPIGRSQPSSLGRPYPRRLPTGPKACCLR